MGLPGRPGRVDDGEILVARREVGRFAFQHDLVSGNPSGGSSSNGIRMPGRYKASFPRRPVVPAGQETSRASNQAHLRHPTQSHPAEFLGTRPAAEYNDCRAGRAGVGPDLPGAANRGTHAMKTVRSRPFGPGLFWGLLLAWGFGALAAAADVPRVLPPGELPHDQRLGDLKTLNDYFPFHPCDSPEAWAKRAERVRRQVLVATGLWPMPTKTPANAVDPRQGRSRRVHGREGLFRELSRPFVTGSLYRPKGRSTARGRACSAPTATGPTAGSTTPARRPSASRSSKGPSGSIRAAATRSRPAASSWPGWAASCSSTTWSAMPTASSSPTAPACAKK